MPTTMAPAGESTVDDAERVPRPLTRLAFVAPTHRDDPDWPWVTRIEPLDRYECQRVFIDSTWKRFPRLTRPWRRWRYARAMKQVADAGLVFSFSTDISMGITSWPARRNGDQKLVYVGFTQDGPWDEAKLDRIGRALRQFDLVCTFTEAERRIYIERYALRPDQIRVVPIHTDETEGYAQYPDESPRDEPYVLSLGSPNRTFKPLAEACKRLSIPLVIMTRPWHEADDLDELRALGAEVITDADKMRALTCLKHARVAAMDFLSTDLPGGYTTLVHAMFMRTPFLVSDCLGMDEHVISDETGFVTPHGDAKALEATLDQMWNEPGLAEKFGDAAYARAVERHSLDAAAHAYAGIVDELT